MKQSLRIAAAAAVVLATACSDDSNLVAPDDQSGLTTVVITEGSPSPAPTRMPIVPRSDLAVGASLGGSTTTPVALKASTCSGSSATITITYTITGRQQNAASFKVNTNWAYNGATWAGSVPTPVSIAAREATDPPTIRTVDVLLTNGSAQSSGTSSFSIVPFDIVTSAPAALNVTAGNATIHVEFDACAVTNTAPVLVLPISPVVIEATSSAGAFANPLTYVTANDAQDGDLTASVVCTPAAGTFSLGSTTVNCSVTDSHGVTTNGSFTITVEDTTDPVFTWIPTGTINRIAQNSSGWVFDADGFGITASDVNQVSEPVTVNCTHFDADGIFAIGSTTQISCTATDAANNISEPATFNVFVTLDVGTGLGFQTPLRVAAPYSAHKKGSTIPHKFPAPKYADGTLAKDLAASLRLMLVNTGIGGQTFDTETAVDFSSGSTAWRWDEEGQHYIYNVKTDKFNLGGWTTTVSLAGITLASTQFELRK